MAARTGKAYIYINGVLQEAMAGAKLDGVGGSTRELVKGTQRYGYSEEVSDIKLTCSFAHGPGISVEALNAITDGVVQFECDSGPIFTLTDAFNMTADLDVAGHKVDCTFGAMDSQEAGAADSTSA
ncbi:MAG TPA: phage tail tube protein [Stellaceae bacterium]|jgi:hypothetical protein